MTPDSLIYDIIEVVREHRFTSGIAIKENMPNDDRLPGYSVFKSNYKGNSCIYIEKRCPPARSTGYDWCLYISVKTPWGKVRASAVWDGKVSNAHWRDTPDNLLMLYKLSRP